MQSKSKNQSLKVGDVITTPQEEKYEILQRINSNKKAQKEPLSTLFDHVDTFIVKRHSNKVYYIKKRFLVPSQKSAKQSPNHSPSKEKNMKKQIKSKILLHPNLLVIQEAYFLNQSVSQRQSKTLIIIEQYCEEGDLAYFVKQQTKKSIKQGRKDIFSQKIISKWLLQILLALEHLHFNKSTHQCLDPNNIFLTPLGNLKLNENYFVNSIVPIKDTKKSKGSPSSSTEGNESLINQKKFKTNERKDIFDFGVLISYLCNPRGIKDPKKQDKNKNISHLPSLYSKELQSIYSNCINIKKTGIEVKDILRTPYFLQVMREFIIDKKLSISSFERIPIKKYAIHKKSIVSKPVKLKKKEERDEKQIITIDVKLPKIERNSKQLESKQSNRKVEKNEPRDKQVGQFDVKKVIRASLEKLKNKLEINNKDKLMREKRLRKDSFDDKGQRIFDRKGSKQKPKMLLPLPPQSRDSNKNTLLPPPSLPKNKKAGSKGSESPMSENKKQTRHSRQRNRQNQNDPMSRSQSASPQKTIQQSLKYNLTPDITFGKKTPEVTFGKKTPLKSNREQNQLINLKQPTQNTEVETNSEDSKLSELQKISDNLAKIFSDLKIREDDQDELSFQMDQEDEESLRLTFKEEKQAVESQQNLMKTYKWKFDQIVTQLQQKYQPSLQTIIQKTNEWDSNDFFVNKQFLNRLRLQENKENLISQK